MPTASLTEYLFFSGSTLRDRTRWSDHSPQHHRHFMCLELMLAAASLTLVAFTRANTEYYGLPDYDGQMLVFFIITVAAAEVAVGLSHHRSSLPSTQDHSARTISPLSKTNLT